MEKRNAIIELHLAGISAPLITVYFIYFFFVVAKSLTLLNRQLKVAKSAVYDNTKNWEITQDHPRTGRPRTAHTQKKRERIRRNPRRTIKGMAESLGISPYSMLSIVKKDPINILEILSPALIEMKSK